MATKCEALPEPCTINNGGCEQKCTNVNFRPVCSCNEGWRKSTQTKCEKIPTTAPAPVHAKTTAAPAATAAKKESPVASPDKYEIQLDRALCSKATEIKSAQECKDLPKRFPKTVYQRNFDNAAFPPGCFFVGDPNRKQGGLYYNDHSEGAAHGSVYPVCLKAPSGGPKTDPCTQNNGGCDQICTNVDNKAVCSCRSGF